MKMVRMGKHIQSLLYMMTDNGSQEFICCVCTENKHGLIVPTAVFNMLIDVCDTAFVGFIDLICGNGKTSFGRSLVSGKTPSNIEVSFFHIQNNKLVFSRSFEW